jgi:hypothetical protein
MCRLGAGKSTGCQIERESLQRKILSLYQNAAWQVSHADLCSQINGTTKSYSSRNDGMLSEKNYLAGSRSRSQ